MNNLIFTENLVKGHIAETIFAQMLRDTGGYTVLEFGYEKIVPELVQHGYGTDSQILNTLRSAPDFAVIRRTTNEVRLIEVKYRQTLLMENVLECARKMHTSWNPSYLFVATREGFYFDEVSTIIHNEGVISPFIEIPEELQNKYLQILRNFERQTENKIKPVILPTLGQIVKALHKTWASDTCFVAEEWSEDNPARGQCVVSSLVVQDYLGGELRRYHVIGDGFKETHYCNILADGTILDTTASQYRTPVTLEIVPIDLKGFASVREKRLADNVTRNHYELLKKRVASYLANS
jgi:hypothetical protein